LIGRYELLDELARGGMAIVYLARQVEPELIERPVVLKQLRGASSERLLRALSDEARTLTNVRHPNVVPILDVVEAEGELFLVLEHVDSVSLAELTSAASDAGERVPVAIASRIVCDTLAGLHAAHEAKSVRGVPLAIIHRDVSPQNVLVGADGVSRLIDFGIAKAEDREAPTTSTALKGKVGYFAPEQLQGLELDRRVDVFTAGIVLHELLAGRRLFRGSDHASAMMRVLLDEIPPVTTLRDDVPPELDAILERALARDRDSRYATAGELLEELARVVPPASSLEVARYVERVSPGLLARKRASLRALMATPVVRRRARRRELALGFAVAGLLGVAVVASLAVRHAPPLPAGASLGPSSSSIVMAQEPVALPQAIAPAATPSDSAAASVATAASASPHAVEAPSPHAMRRSQGDASTSQPPGAEPEPKTLPAQDRTPREVSPSGAPRLHANPYASSAAPKR
jgi:serine/threonine protein kinase